MDKEQELDYIEPYNEISEKVHKNKDNEYNINYEED